MAAFLIINSISLYALQPESGKYYICKTTSKKISSFESGPYDTLYHALAKWIAEGIKEDSFHGIVLDNNIVSLSPSKELIIEYNVVISEFQSDMEGTCERYSVMPKPKVLKSLLKDTAQPVAEKPAKESKNKETKLKDVKTEDKKSKDKKAEEATTIDNNSEEIKAKETKSKDAKTKDSKSKESNSKNSKKTKEASTLKMVKTTFEADPVPQEEPEETVNQLESALPLVIVEPVSTTAISEETAAVPEQEETAQKEIIATPSQKEITQKEKETEEARLLEEQQKAEEARLLAEQQKAEEEKRQKELAEKARIEQELKEAEEKKQQEEAIQKALENAGKANGYSRYQKEYLQDYMKEEISELPNNEDTEDESLIANPDQKDSNGQTLLMKAAKSGNEWQLKLLIKSGADVNLKDKDGWTALMYAVRYQESAEAINMLLTPKTEVKAKNNFDSTALLMAACYNSNPEILRKLLSYYSVSEKEVLKAFIQLLTANQIPEYVQMAKIKIFLEKSIQLNTFYEGKTPLMYAAQYSNSTKIIKLLLDNGCVTTVRSTEGKTAFEYATKNTKLKHDDYYWALNQK